MQFFKQFIEFLAVLGVVNGFHGGAKNLIPRVGNGFGKFNRGLTAELHHHSRRLFDFQYADDVFGGKRFEIKFVADVEVGGNGFGIVVYDYRLIPRRFDGFYALNGAVIEFHALPYTDRSAAKYDNGLLPVAAASFSSS